MAELIAKRYGYAIYQLAIENNSIDEISEQMKVIKNVLLYETDFVDLLNHPKIVIEEKIKLVESIFKNKINDDLLGLMVLTINKRRQNHLIEIFDYCLEQFDEYNGILKAFITSADVLSTQQKDNIKARLEELTKKTVITEYQSDQSLIGGLIIRIGDRIVDNSIKGKLNSMSRVLFEA